jgi:hypothetical protein
MILLRSKTLVQCWSMAANLPFIKGYNKDYHETVAPLDDAQSPSARPQTMILQSII